jgi:hypothetical protein
MTCSAIAIASAVLIALVAFPQGEASAQMTKDQQKCANAMNKNFAKVSKTHGKALGDCVKNNAKGKLTDPTVSACFANPDKKGKVQKAAQKTDADYDKNCVGLDKENNPKLPTWGVTDPNVVNAAAVYNEVTMMRAVFGWDPDAALLAAADYKDPSKCQQTVVKALGKCQATMLKEFNKCKKGGLKDGSITDASGLEACVTELWANPKVSPACGAKLSDAIGKKCSGMLDDPNLPLFPGDCDGEADLADCVGKLVWFDVCMALNEVDALSTDCLVVTGARIGYTLNEFKDERFCVGGDNDGLPCTDTTGHSDCPPGASIPYDPNNDARCLQLGFSNINVAGPPPDDPPIERDRPIYILSLPLTGGSSIECGPVDPVTGTAECMCQITGIEGADAGVVGFVCFEPVTDCNPGLIDCDGGTPLDADLFTDHDIGLCGLGVNDPNFPADDPGDPNTPGVGNSECEWLCRDYCAALPGNYDYFVSGCEGYCSGGDRPDRICDLDVECQGGSCTGNEPVNHENHCQCQCLEIGGNPARPGGFFCETGLRIVVENEGPCDYKTNPTEPKSIVGSRCGTNTTETATASIENTNLIVGYSYTLPPVMGIPLDSCNSLAYGTSGGSTQVGHRIFHDGSGTGDQISISTTPNRRRPYPLSP